MYNKMYMFTRNINTDCSFFKEVFILLSEYKKYYRHFIFDIHKKYTYCICDGYARLHLLLRLCRLGGICEFLPEL